MEVILLERIGKLGQMGDVVRVKDGFARNFLLPKGKALRATKENRTKFEIATVELRLANARCWLDGLLKAGVDLLGLTLQAGTSTSIVSRACRLT